MVGTPVCIKFKKLTIKGISLVLRTQPPQGAKQQKLLLRSDDISKTLAALFSAHIGPDNLPHVINFHIV